MGIQIQLRYMLGGENGNLVVDYELVAKPSHAALSGWKKITVRGVTPISTELAPK